MNVRRLPLTPLAAALATVWPLISLAATLPKPPSNAVPVPSASWRVYGNGGAAPINKPNGGGGVDQTISQTSSRGIYQWGSFDIGDKSSVTFDMAVKGASALNRIGGAAPSRIFGKLSATNGGEIFLINGNGILFGQGAVVDTGSLVASALNISDSEYLSGFAQSLANRTNPDLNAAFRYDGAPEDFIDSKNFVQVDPGATLRTASGGRIFLFAKRVENAGTLETPSGQTVLAAGGEIYLKLPESETLLYASETNPAISAVRGFLVEVGAGPADAPEGSAGRASNLATGVINTPRGNTTLIGMAVNQMGRISATTSVSENGSVILRAQGNARPSDGSGNVIRATESGTLTLGEGSRIEIGVDTTLGADGKPLTSTDTAGFATSHIDLAGHTVVFERDAGIVAPGATVNVRAESLPTYDVDAALTAGTDDTARIIMRAGSTIDVSGTTGTVESVARHFITTELLGSNDLKDAPIQKDGLLYRSRAMIDTREDSPILGSLDSYRSNIARTAEERLSAGGTVRLRAEGGVATEAGSRIDVSGGQVRYTEAQVRETQLMGEDGRTYTLADAPADMRFLRASNLLKSSQATYDRWGLQVAYGSVTPSRTEAGYTEGRSAGTLQIAAPTVALGGKLLAGTVQGDRQQAGLDARASGGTLHLGAVVNGGKDFDVSTGPDAVLRNFTVGSQGTQFGEAFWEAPADALLPEQSAMSLTYLQSTGFQDVAIAANGATRFGDDAKSTYHMADGGSLRVLSSDDAATLGASVRGAAGSVQIESKRWDITNPRLGGIVKSQGAATVEDGVTVDLSGHWVNQALGQLPLDHSATTGGSFVAQGYGVTLGQGSVIDVSGGATVSTSGTVTGANAGSVALADHTLTEDADHNTVQLNGELRGYSAASAGGQASGGGSLAISTHHVRIDNEAQPDATPGLALGAGFFDQGGFQRFDIGGRLSVDVGADTRIAPNVGTWQAPANAVLAANGQTARDVLQSGLAHGLRPASSSITLSAGGESADHTAGVLNVGRGAVIDAGDQGSVNLSAAHRLDFEGGIVAHGGNATLAIKGSSEAEANVLWVGEQARIDVSGTTVIQPGRTDGQRVGQVLAGGNITLNAGQGYASHLVLHEGAQLDARGARGTLDVTELGASGMHTDHRVIDSAGGSVTLASNGALLAEGDVRLQGSGSAAGGSLSVALQSADKVDTDAILDPRALELAAQRTALTPGLDINQLAVPDAIDGRARLGADWLQAAGAGQLRLASSDTLTLAESITLNVNGTLSLAARGLGAAAGTTSHLSAGQVFIGWTGSDVGRSDTSHLPPAPEATAGDAALRIDATAGLVLDGNLSTQGLGQLTIASGGDMRLQSRDVQLTGRYQAGLKTQADLTLSADQVYAATDTDYRIEAAGHLVRVERSDPTEKLPPKPLSAAGGVAIAAADIVQAGVIRSPLGHISLEATNSLTLAQGSETSVSAAGLTTLYGTATDNTWTKPGSGLLDATPDKRIELNAPTLSTQAGSVTDVSGGGALIATEFVPGKGGSKDILAAGSGYALVPGQTALGSADPSLAAGAAAQGHQIVISQAVKLPDGSTLAAGTYTLLPARYAMLPGAFFVRPSTYGAPLADGIAIARNDGSVLLGASTSTAGSSAASSLPQTWQLMSKATALRYSEIREHDLGNTFAARAAHDGIAAPELPNDGGAVVLRAAQATLEGSGRYAAATDSKGQTLGLAGRTEIVADKIQVDAGRVDGGGDGVLHLSAASLNQIGGGSVVLGATSNGIVSGADGSRLVSLEAQSSSVVFAQGSQALTVGDLTAATTGTLQVNDGAVFTPNGTGTGASTGYALRGDGAALRVSAGSGAVLERTKVDGLAGDLQVGSGVRVNAPSGSLIFDSSRTAQLAPDARLAASQITLAAGAIAVGEAQDGALSLTPELAAQVSSADQLTLRGYEQIGMSSGATLGQAGLQSLVLDSAHLRVSGDAAQPAQIVAGAIRLTNTTGVKADPDTTEAGGSALQLRAVGRTGVIGLGDGSMAFDNVGQLTLRADQAIALEGKFTLVAPGDVALETPSLVAGLLAGEADLNVAGTLRIDSNGAAATAAALDGGRFSAVAQRIEQAGRIVLPSGEVTLQGREGVQVATGSVTDVAGRTVTLDGIAVDQRGGRIAIGADTGDVALQAGARLDVSGAGRSGAGSSLSLAAAQGEVQLGATLVGHSGSDAAGARIALDARQPLDMERLASDLAGQFSAEVALRQREGALTIDAGQSFKAERIALSADQGALTVRGTLDASSSSGGGAIALASGNDLVLDAGARLLAQSAGKEGNGGRIDLNSVAGRIRVGAGSEMQLGGGSESGEGGKLTLRAARENTVDVAIDPLAGLIEGAARIDVQAVRVYDGIVRITDRGQGAGKLNPEDVNADNAAFIGVFGENAEAIAQRLGGGRTEILDALKVHAEAEVRSNGILRVEPEFDWILGRESESVLNMGGNAAHVGDSSLTLRAAGKLTIGRTIESGYGLFGVRSAQGGTIRAIAGADLQAAAPDATANGVEGEHLVVSNRSLKRSQEWVNIRTTTGDIVLAASGDVDLRDRGIVQTAGGPQDADADKAMIALNLNANSFPVFGRNGGDVTINAGHDVLASEAGLGGVTGYASLFSTRTGNDLDAFYTGVVTSADLSHGVLSLAGGDIRVNAGRDVVNLVAASAGNAYVVDDGISKVVHAFAGGNAELRAGRDVVNGLVAATGGRLDVQAGRDVVRDRKADGTRVTTPGLRLYYGDTDVRVDGRRDVDIGLVNSRWFSFDADLVSDNWLTGFDNAARLNAVAAAGHLAFNAATTDNDGSWALLPAQTRFVAAHGDIHVGETGIDFVRLVQQPTKNGSLELLAGGSLNSETNVPWQINASRGANAEQADLRSPDITAELQIGIGQLTSDARWTDGSQLDQGDRSPVRFVAATGDLGIGDDIVSARPVRLVAGNDLTLYGESKIQLQHQTDTELSLLQAGRDINFTDSLVRAAGPGELVLLAGRDIDLGRADQQAYGSGVVAIGNSDNTLLERRSAAITLVAGLRGDGSDYGGAVAQGFHVLGSAVLAKHAGDLYALLSESSPPALGGAEAKAFDALDSAGQLARIKTLMGDKAYDTALAAYVRGLPGNESLDSAAALAAFTKQSPARQDAAPAALLAGMFASQPPADRQSFVLQLAAAEKSRTGAGLQAWMKLRTGQDLSLADAAAQFERLPLERQVSWLNQVLVDELRTSGRAAAGTSGYDAEAAYLRGYAAINTVFAIDRPEGEIRLPSTQVKTLQPGNVELVAATDKQRAVTLGAITLMTPGGGVDAGELGSSAQKANNLGVVTVSGGDIAGVVRHDFAVNQSRVFSLAEGDILLWSSEGDIDAGRGAKTVTGAPAPVLRLDVSTGKLFLDTSGSFTGSGIAVLDAKSELDLYAPAGAIDAGEAGIRARGNVFLGAQVVRGADNLQVGGSVVGAPVAASTVNPSASLSAAAGALAPPAPTDDEDERRRRRAARRTLLLEFLGFGRG